MAFPYPDTEFYRLCEKDKLLEVDDVYALMVEARVRVGAKPVTHTVFSSLPINRHSNSFQYFYNYIGPG